MLWIILAMAGYLLGALALVTDKFLISSRRLPYPAGYAFLTSFFSLFVVALAWLEPTPSDFTTRSLSVVSGGLFIYGLYFLYASLEKHPVSVVIPLVSVVSAVVTLLPSIFILASGGGAGRNLLLSLLAFGLFVAGGFLIAFDLPVRGIRMERAGHVLLAGVLLALSSMVLKYGYAVSGIPFVGSLVWSRIGFFIGGCSFLLVPALRRQIVATAHGLMASGAGRRTGLTGAIFVSNKVLGGAGVLLINAAVYLGPVSLIQSMDSLRFAFVFLLAHALSRPFPEIFGERLFFWDWIQKWMALGILGLALWLASQVAVGGLPAFF